MMKKLNSMRDLFLHELKDMYDAEQQLVKALPKMAEKASSAELKSALNEHCEQTKGHVGRLEQCFEILGEKAAASTCKPIRGAIDSTEETLSHMEEGELRDAAIVAAAQKTEHHEIASYGTLAEWAKNLNLTEIKNLIGQSLSEEIETDQKLTELARDGINRIAKEAA